MKSLKRLVARLSLTGQATKRPDARPVQARQPVAMESLEERQMFSATFGYPFTPMYASHIPPAGIIFVGG